MLDHLAHRVHEYCAPHNRLHRRNIAVFSAVIALPFVLGFAASFMLLYEGLTDLSLERRQAIAVPVALALHERLSSIEDAGVSLSIHPTLREAAVAGDWERAEEVMKIFRGVTDEPFIDNIFLVDAAGTAQSITSEDRSALGNNYSHRDWYEGVHRVGGPYLSDVYERATHPRFNVVTFVVPVADGAGETAAILGFQIRLDHFVAWSSDITVGENGFVYMVGHQGTLIAHPDVLPQEEVVNVVDDALVARALSGERGTAIIETANGKHVVAYELVPEYGWAVFVQQPATSAFATRNSVLTFVSALFLALFVVYALIIFLAMRVMVRNHIAAVSGRRQGR